MPPQPDRLRQVKFQIAMFHRPVISLANITQNQQASRQRGDLLWGSTFRKVGWSGDRESHCVPNALSRRPIATAGIPKIAECLQNILRRQFAFVAGSRAVPAPPAAEW